MWVMFDFNYKSTTLNLTKIRPNYVNFATDPTNSEYQMSKEASSLGWKKYTKLTTAKSRRSHAGIIVFGSFADTLCRWTTGK